MTRWPAGVRGGLKLHLVLCGCAAGPAAWAPSSRGGAGRQAASIPRYADVPFVEPIEVEAPPDQLDADDGVLHAGRRKRVPVLGDEPERNPEAPPIRTTPLPLPPGPMDQIIAGATLQREYPGFQEHHLFPRQTRLRQQFEEIGINVDAWTILVDPTRHAIAHGDQATFGLGGRWN